LLSKHPNHPKKNIAKTKAKIELLNGGRTGRNASGHGFSPKKRFLLSKKHKIIPPSYELKFR
jgi:hypothetical protein